MIGAQLSLSISAGAVLIAALSTPGAAQIQQSVSIKTPPRGPAAPRLSKEHALDKLREAVGPLGVVVNPCAEPVMLASKAMAIVEERLRLLQRMRAYSELHELAETTQRRGWPAWNGLDVACRSSGPQLSNQEYEAHSSALDLRGREISAAQAAFARYRVAVGH